MISFLGMKKKGTAHDPPSRTKDAAGGPSLTQVSSLLYYNAFRGYVSTASIFESAETASLTPRVCTAHTVADANNSSQRLDGEPLAKNKIRTAY